MRKMAYAAVLGAFCLTAAMMPVSATESVAHKRAAVTDVAMTPMPGMNSSGVIERLRTAQVLGNICRYGAAFCVTGGVGWVGNGCCGCGFCGVWSTW